MTEKTKQPQFFDGLVQFKGDVEVPADSPGGTSGLYLVDDVNGTRHQVTLGAANSGGAGFRTLLVPNNPL